ncbi:PQQ-binding-like beta-propeller repeat protein [Haloarcula salinisoli]|uniref:PQQ-binding-like beta-propeller repeat protein n=1 Tax=Haloarcula salinisoli TaxID=2487746 RepID=A0A8J7YJG7_9EURY|nr:PQQ-binding-like beta-propeller repeat protein [Halomicroarcula salinisoli]MBX0304239.1 PQQ-binding-like beta-propeller repeat protein [Halomicroarcula salinisoli]
MTNETGKEVAQLKRSRRLVLHTSLTACASALAGCGTFDGTTSTTTRNRDPDESAEPAETDEPDGPVEPPESSRRLWAQSLGISTGTPPVVVDGTVVYGTEAGTVFGFDAAEGQQVWTYEKGNRGAVTDIAVDDSTVYLGRRSGSLEAFALDDRAQRWQDSLGSNITGLTFDDSTLYAGTLGIVETDGESSVSGRCLAYDTDDGDQRWATDTAGAVLSQPVVSGDTVYIGTTEIVALETGTGATRWTGGRGSVVEGVAVGERTLYATDKNGIWALEKADGSTVWEVERSVNAGGNPALADGQLYTATGQSEIGAVDAETGEITWEGDIDAIPSTKVVLTDETAYVGSFDGVVALDRTDGAIEWRHTVPGRINTLGVDGGIVYVGDSDGTAVAIES